LTEHSLRETQKRIEQVLHMDYDTFINVSFFLQGRADQFAQQPPTRRKEILGNILGLEIWDEYKVAAADRRKDAEVKQKGIESVLAEIDAELGEESARKAALAEHETLLESAVSSRKALEASLASIRQTWAGLAAQQELSSQLAQGLEQDRTRLTTMQARLKTKRETRQPYADLVARAGEIEASHAGWKTLQTELEQANLLAGRHRELERKQAPFQVMIQAEKARLEQTLANLEQQEAQAEKIKGASGELAGEIEAAGKELAAAEQQAAETRLLEAESQAGKEEQAGLVAENAGLKRDMDAIDARMDNLKEIESTQCPLCGQALTPEHRQSTLKALKDEGDQKAEVWRKNKARYDELGSTLKELGERITLSRQAEDKRLTLGSRIAQLRERQETGNQVLIAWENQGKPDLARVKAQLEGGQYALQSRLELEMLDKEIAALGYDAAAHETLRSRESQARAAGQDFLSLETARASLGQLEDEIANLDTQVGSLDLETRRKEAEYTRAAEALQQARAAAPDLTEAEKAFAAIQAKETEYNQQVGAARQRVAVLDRQRKRKKSLQAEHEEVSLLISRYRTLERAFGRDGVPALLIEQALPVIELKTNEFLGRLSDDSMHLRFETQAKYKDDKRNDLKETLEIQVSDGAGLRDYELFSGGEAFRINFSIRLALAEVLAQRKGARLQMLVIDEGFGSQDALGRQRLIQAINTVRQDFARILVITHLEELKDAFPTRIEVEKTERGSTIAIVQ
jgi:exonuclease SbcC